LVALKGYLVSVVLSMAVLQFWGFPACKTGDFHFAILGIFSLQETEEWGKDQKVKIMARRTAPSGHFEPVQLMRQWCSV